MSTAQRPASTVPVSDVGRFADATEFLDPAPHALEMGVARASSGVLTVAARTVMPRCSGAAFEWWFRYACNTDQYLWWHPLDHVSSEWAETSPQTHIGSTHIVRERLGADPHVHALQIHFVDPVELFGDAYPEALERGDVSGCAAAMIGMGDEPVRDERGRPNMGRMAHICRDTRDGMVLRSRFWIGEGSGAPAEVLNAEIPDAMGLGLMQHAFTEFTFLARILPSLYDAAHPEDVELPW